MKVYSCQPHRRTVEIDNISYEDAMILKTLLEKDCPRESYDYKGPSRWGELIAALELLIVANRPAETVAKSG